MLSWAARLTAGGGAADNRTALNRPAGPGAGAATSSGTRSTTTTSATGTTATAANPSSGRGRAPEAVADDGFTAVRRGRWSSDSQAADNAMQDGATGGVASPARPARGGDDGLEQSRGADSARNGDGDLEEAPHGSPGGQRQDPWHTDGDADMGEGETQHETTHHDLFRELQEEREELRTLRKKWGNDHWTVKASIQRVQEAEAAWRREKPSTAPSRMLQRAEHALKKADARIDQIYEKLEQLDNEYWERQRELQDQLGAAKEKQEEAQEQLRQARVEVANEGRQHGTDAPAAANGRDRQLLVDTVATLREDIGPQLMAVTDLVQTTVTEGGEDVKQKLQAVVARMHDMFGVLQQHAQEQPHATHGQQWQGQRYYDLTAEDLPELTEEEYPYCYGYGNDGRCGNWHGYGYQYQGYHQNWHGWNYGQSADVDKRGEAREAGLRPGEGTPATKKVRVVSDDMEQQEFDDMQVPAHLNADSPSATTGNVQLDPAAANAAAPAAAAAAADANTTNAAGGGNATGDNGVRATSGCANAPADAAAAAAAAEVQARLLHEANIGKFVALAQSKGVNIDDIDLATITTTQLQQFAEQRLSK